MTPAQIEEALQLVNSWNARHEQQPAPRETSELQTPVLELSRLPLAPVTGVQLIKDVQILLSGMGYDPGPVDGILGKRTQAAIRAYQRAVGSPQDGEITAELLKRLHVSQAPPRTN
jgi:localization factor PodJL